MKENTENWQSLEVELRNLSLLRDIVVGTGFRAGGNDRELNRLVSDFANRFRRRVCAVRRIGAVDMGGCSVDDTTGELNVIFLGPTQRNFAPEFSLSIALSPLSCRFPPSEVTEKAINGAIFR